MEVRKLHPIFAAELAGVDASRPDRALIDTVEALMAEHAVLCIRDQGHLDDAGHVAFARAFGPLELPPPPVAGTKRRVGPGLYDVSNLDEQGGIIDRGSLRAQFAKGNELFHADSSFNDLPSKWSILRGVIVPPERGDTEFIDMRHVYDALPDATKRRIEPLVAEHSYVASRIKAGADPAQAEQLRKSFPGAWQPLVRTSASGRKALFVGAHATRIDGMDEADGAALIAELLAFATQERFIYAHKWRQGDIVIWDNRCTLHRGTAFDYENHKRDLRRATINESGEEVCAVAA